MRDILVTLIVFGSIPFIFKKPYIGIIVWAWLSYMNPHRLTYGFAYEMPFAQIIALVLFAAILLNGKDKQKISMNGLMALWVFFLVWMTFSTVLSIYPEDSLEFYIKVMKIQLLTFLTLMLINSKDKLDKLIWIIVISIGFYSVKGGVFTITSGGAHRVWGPPGSFIEENNGLAIATLMTIPLMYYLYNKEKNRWIKYALASSIFFSLVSSVGSQSRGALLAIVAVMGFFWLKTKNKLLTGFLIIILSIIGFNFMPESWHERMNTIENYEENASAMGRINAWIFSINIANDRFFGGGFNSWTEENYAIYSPDATQVSVAHSIYFNVLADHGWVGLIIFLFIFLLTWNILSSIIKRTRYDDKYGDYLSLAKMLQISFIAYFVGGAFLSLSYFDLPWHLIAISVLLQKLSVSRQPA
jgi:probable O-glycosylation ligase (exosortase A-associated)